MAWESTSLILREVKCVSWNSAAFKTAVFEILLFQVQQDKACLLEWFELFLEKGSTGDKFPLYHMMMERTLFIFFLKWELGVGWGELKVLIILCCVFRKRALGHWLIVIVLGCRGDECLRQVSWEHHGYLCILFLWADAVEYLRKKHGALLLLYSFVGLQGKTARAFLIILSSCCWAVILRPTAASWAAMLILMPNNCVNGCNINQWTALLL